MANRNENITNLDLNQMQLRSLDSENDAQRVILVGQELNIDSSQIKEALQEGLKNIKVEVQSESSKEVVRIEVPQIIKETVIERIEIPVIVKELQRVEIPIIVPEIKIVEIEKPVIITETKIVEIIKESHDKSLKLIQIILLSLNALSLLGLLLSKLIK